MVNHLKRIEIMQKIYHILELRMQYEGIPRRFFFDISFPDNTIYQIMLDLDKIDPDWNVAQNHGKACRPGRPVRELSSSTSINININSPHHHLCECCLNIIDKEDVPLTNNSKQLQFLGFGFPLYFIFIKYVIALLLLQIATYAALSISWALDHSDDICNGGTVRHLPSGDEGQCTSWLIKFMRTQESVSGQEILLRFCAFFMQMVALAYMRDVIGKTNRYYEERETSISNYSIFIRNLPKKEGMKNLLRDFFQKDEGRSCEVVEQIIPLGQLEYFHDLRAQKLQIIKQIQGLLNKHQDHKQIEKFQTLRKSLKEIQAQISIENQKQVTLFKSDRIIFEKAIVILATQQQKQSFFLRFSKLTENDFKRAFGEGSENIQIEHAPQPKQIIWQNINLIRKKRLKRRFLGWSLTILFIFAVTAIFFGAIQAKTHAVEQALHNLNLNPDDPAAHEEQMMALAGTIITLIIVIVFNKFLLSYILHLITDVQKHRKSSEYEFSFCLKYTLCLFFTTAIMTLLVEALVFHNIYKEQYGVVEEQSIMFFLTAFLVPIIWLINPWYLFKLAQRKCFNGKKEYTQREANYLMQDPRYSVGKRYAQIIKAVWFTYLYCSLIPAGAVLIIIGLGLFYWVDKYNLLRKSSVIQSVNGGLSMMAMKLLDFSLMLRSIGELIFDSQIRSGVAWQSIVCLILGVIYVILPMDSILDFFHEEKFKSQQKAYKEVKNRFVENYISLHPLFASERAAIATGINLVSNSFDITRTRTVKVSQSHIKQDKNNSYLFEKPINYLKIHSYELDEHEQVGSYCAL